MQNKLDFDQIHNITDDVICELSLYFHEVKLESLVGNV